MKRLTLGLILVVSGCGTVSIKSTPPEADVTVVLPLQETPKKLGQTPYSADLSELTEIVNTGTIVLRVEKKGFITQSFIVPNLGGGKLELEANLLPILPSNYREVNSVVSKVLDAERMLLENRLEDALKQSEEIKKINENVSAAFEIEASVYFLQKEFKKSRFAWIRALELDPNNSEVQKMLAMVEEKLGIGTAKIPAPDSKGTPP